MATTKPTKPSITLPSAFGTSVSNVKTPFTAQELIDGYSASIQQVLDGGNVNWLNDTLFKYLTYTTTLCDWLNGTGVKKIPYVNSSNQLDYMDSPTGAVIGQIISLLCTSDYIPDGCLPCDGQEYAKSVLSDFWDNYLTSSPALLPVCTYADYASDISTYGQCGKFAIDNVNETFKVPTIKDGSYLTQAKSDSELGKAYNESLPNITGTFGGARDGVVAASGAFSRTSNGNAAWYTNGNQSASFDFDASRSSSVYQNDAVVQGNNVRVRYFVVVSSGQTNQAQMDWNAWASSLNNRMDKDASNASTTAKETIVGWGMPDYTAGVSITISTTDTTITSKGVIMGGWTCTGNNSWKIYVNGEVVVDADMRSSTSSSCAIFIPVEVGDVVKSSVAVGNPVTIFYPYKGVNNA